MIAIQEKIYHRTTIQSQHLETETQTGSRTHEEKTRSCYAIGAEEALFYVALTVVSKGGKDLIPFPLKSGFYCVTDT